MNYPCYIDCDRIKNNISQFQCPICFQLPNDPRECGQCGALIGNNCLQEWLKKKTYQLIYSACPKCRDDHKNFRQLKGALLQVFNDIDVKCKYDDCLVYCKVNDLRKHEISCKKPKCFNYTICGKIADSEILDVSACSQECRFMYKMQNSYQNQQKLYEEITIYTQNIYKQAQLNLDLKMKKYNQEKLKDLKNKQPDLDLGIQDSQDLRWSLQYVGSQVKLEKNNTCAILEDQAYVFKTVLADKPFLSGVHYWEIIGLEMTENEMKIGVATQTPLNFDQAFCDFNDGFAYYGLGQLRNGSNGQGVKYGKKYLKGDRLGVLLDMNQGILAFGVQYYKNRNGDCWGVGFKTEKLKNSPIYAAVALLHCAGCLIVSNIPIPQSFQAIL